MNPSPSHPFPLRTAAVLTSALLLLSSTTLAGLPQPMFIYYGQARDGFGLPYRQQAEVLLLRGNTIVARHSIQGYPAPGVNFVLYAHLDDGRSAANYASRAVRTGDRISILVRDAYGQKTIMEQKTLPPVGQPGEMVAIQVTAGEDSDDDRLPDQWEWELIHWSNGDLLRLDQVNPDDDYDGDGQSNGDEYRAGTFAFLDYDYFFAERMAVTPNGRIEVTFFGVEGKTYTAQHKAALDDALWIDTPFAVADTAEFLTGPLVGAGNWVSIYLPKDQVHQFFRLTVE